MTHAIVLSLLVFRGNLVYLTLISLSATLGFIHSARLFRLMGKSILDLCANALGFCAGMLFPLYFLWFKQYFNLYAGRMERVSVSVTPSKL